MKVSIQSETEKIDFDLREEDIRSLYETAARLESNAKRSPRGYKGDRPKYNPEAGHKGFMIVRCKSCGKTKGFCAKTPITSFRCHCGEETQLGDMRRAFVTCKCGGNFKYRTNIRDDYFEFNCLNCGSPVDLYWNEKKKAYESAM